MCFGNSKEPYHRDGSFEYPKHCFGLDIRKIISNNTLLSRGLCYNTKHISAKIAENEEPDQTP